MPTTKESSEPILVTKEEVLNEIRVAIEKRYEQLKEASDNTTNVWLRHDILTSLNELKFIYENLLR